jgi:spermidine synthase
LRELRLVFGASTHATSAVLAIFMGGLGVGGAVLGARADRHPRPLRLYAWLELGITAGALLSPLLFVLIRHVYIASGGSSVLGQPLALAVRLALSILVLGIPTFLMGGTLPALARAAEPAEDSSRRAVALLYGVNTLGAVFGALAANFFLLEHLGTRLTVLSAAGVNGLVAAAALALSTRAGFAAGVAAGESKQRPKGAGAAAPEPSKGAASLPPRFVYAAAGLTGFVFFLMEMVWYRMLSPLLGGTTYSFGLILAVALAGIGAGSLLWTLLARWVPPSARLFGVTCGLEALGLVLAFGLGDRVAILAIASRPAGDAGFFALAAQWTQISAVVVLPAALVSGFQFPLLIALLGQAGRDVGAHTGKAYAWNTAGAIAGSLVGGFGLLPALGAPGCWRLAVALLGAIGASAVGLSLFREGRRPTLAVAAAALLAAVVLAAGQGPTAAWRHTPIGTGGAALPDDRSANGLRAWLGSRRFPVIWEQDGVESSVALRRGNGLTFVVNGKNDGNARLDAGTQVMGALIGAILHPAPQKAMVIGLGTGSSAGWLAAIDSVRQVDVAELEPVVLEVAQRCAPANHAALEDPKLKVLPGDGRELLLTSKERYDLIFSEPSNPYRAGIAALYTVDFYRAVERRLAPGGFFSQWVQAYDVDPLTVHRIAATLASVFRDVEIWQTSPGDLIFVCSAERKDYPVPFLASQVEREPFKSALRNGWGVSGVDGFLAGFLSDPTLPREAAAELSASGALSTDDLPSVEFDFARSLGGGTFALDEFRELARRRGVHRPAVRGGAVDWDLVDLSQALLGLWHLQPAVAAGVERSVFDAHLEGQFAHVLRSWAAGGWRPRTPLEAVILAEALADAADERYRPLLPQFSREWPATADAIEARFHLRRGNAAGAFNAFSRAIQGYRTDPWNSVAVMGRTLDLGMELSERYRSLAPRVFELFEAPFSVRIQDASRITALLNVGRLLDCAHGVRALDQAGPDFLWNESFLRYRAGCYSESRSPAAGQAQRDLEAFLSGR